MKEKSFFIVRTIYIYIYIKVGWSILSFFVCLCVCVYDMGDWEPSISDDFIDDIISKVNVRPSANIPRGQTDQRRTFPLEIVTPGAKSNSVGQSSGNSNPFMLTGMTMQIHEFESPVRRGSRRRIVSDVDDEEVFEKIPIGMDKYEQNLTVEDYDISDKSLNTNPQQTRERENLGDIDETTPDDLNVIDQLNWDESQSQEDSQEVVHTTRTEPSISHKGKLSQMIRDKQSKEEESKRRRNERMFEFIKDPITTSEQFGDSTQPTRVSHGTSNTFDRGDTEGELSEAMKNLRQIANKCLKNSKSGGQDILKRLQKEVNSMMSQLSEVMGTSNECFLCLFGNRKFDKSDTDKVNGMYNILENLLFTDVTLKAIAVEMFGYYQTEIYTPGTRAGFAYPHWSVEGIEKHIRLHMHDPRIKAYLRMEKVSLVLDLLSTQVTYYDEEDGKTKVNFVAMRLLQTFLKLENDLGKETFVR